MSGSSRPKELLHQAQEAEKSGQNKTASNLYATLAAHLRRHEKWKEAKFMVEKAIELSKSSARLYIQKARIELGLNNDVEAQAAIALFTQYTVEKNHISEYTVYLEEQLRDCPVLRQRYYEGLLEIDRTNGSYFLGLSRSLRQEGKWKEAQGVLLDAVQIKQVRETVLEELETILKDRDLDEAVLFVKKYRAGELAHSDLVSLLSEEKQKTKKKEKTEATNFQTNEKGLRTLIMELEQEIGVEIDSKRDTVAPLVKEFRKRADQVISGDSKARIDMALAFFEMGLNRDAKEELQPISSGDPMYLEAQCLLGEMLVTEGSDLGALEVFQRCLRDERCQDTTAYQCGYELTLIYQRLGDFERALHLASQLEQTAPGFRDVHKVVVQLKDAIKEKNGDPIRK